MTKDIAIPDEEVIRKIYRIRNYKVMLDIDLAELYQVETKRLNEQVKRHIERFPGDFMFQLNNEEWEALRSQFATSNQGRGGRRYAPLAFTEHGVLMLSSVLNSERAIQVNIQIMRIYSRLKEMIMDQKDILLKLDQLEKKLMKQDKKYSKLETDILIIFNTLKQLINPSNPPREKIGYRIKQDEE